MPGRFSVIFLFAIILGAVAPVYPGQVYHVSRQGNDANPGSVAQPWQTLQHAADTVNPGDTVLVRGKPFISRLISQKVSCSV